MRTPGRNDKCSCGSEKKYKQCCMLKITPSQGSGPNGLAPCGDVVTHELRSAVAHFHAGRISEAATICRHILKKLPNHTEALYMLGVMAYDAKDFESAYDLANKAKTINPSNPYYQNLLGSILLQLGKIDEAFICQHKATKIKPDFFEAYNNLGNIYKKQKKFQEAISCYQKAITINPNYDSPYYNIASIFYIKREFTEAINYYKKAIYINKNFAVAHNDLGTALQELDRLNDAALCFRRAIEINPDLYDVYGNLLFCLNYLANESPLKLLSESKRYGALVSRLRSMLYTEWSCPQSATKLRIGFVSGDLRSHPVGYFLEGLLTNIDTSRFELFAYSTLSTEDDLTNRIKPLFSEWREAFSVTDEALATSIHADALHILIDLSGHTANSRLSVFAYKPTPVQVTWLGYFATTGVEEMDYCLGDQYVIPENEECHFVERIWRLPETYLCFTQPTDKVEINSLPAVTSGYITFGCFNNLKKMNDVVVALWANVLKAVPDSRLFLKTKQLDDQRVVEETLNRFAAHGIICDRLTLEGSSPRAELLASYNRVDIALDPFPYPGGTTTLEALWMGVPVLTKCGDRFLSHVGESIAHNANQSEWIAKDDEDYIRKAVKFSSDLDSLVKLRAGLRDQVLASPLFNSPQFARHFEEAMWGMWNEWTSKRDGIQ